MFRTKTVHILVAAFSLLAGVAHAAGDLVTKRSSRPFGETLDRLEAAAKDNGLLVFARIDHAAAAKAAGLQMPPGTMLIVGNPKAGTPQMLEHPTLGIDLPLKMLVWQNQAGEVFVSYNAAAFLVSVLARHGLDASSEKVGAGAKATEMKLETIADAAVK
jgi:uncharacterized protein (DUF302 family)